MIPVPVVVVLDRLVMTDMSLPDVVRCFGSPGDVAVLLRAAQAIQLLVAVDVVQLIDTQHAPEIVCPLWLIASFRMDPLAWITTHPWEVFILRSTSNGRHQWTQDREDLVQRLSMYGIL